MTQPNLIELAKQGDAQAIADIISYLMQSQEVTAKAALKQDVLVSKRGYMYGKNFVRRGGTILGDLYILKD